MVFSLLILIIVGLVAYLHFTFGLFSATLSAVMAILAAVLALGWQEWLVNLTAGKLGDMANGVMIFAIFSFAYVILRVICDKAIPGNVMFPYMVDKIGAAVMGVVAGLATAGVVAVGAQMLPFSTSILGWERYPIGEEQEVSIVVPPRLQQVVAKYRLLNAQKFKEDQYTGLWIPADNFVVALVNLVSDDAGSMSNGTSMASAHPNLLREAFGQRVSLPNGASTTALPEKLNFEEVYLLPPSNATLPRVMDQERLEVKSESGDLPIGVGTRFSKNAPKDLPSLKDSPNLFLVVRVRVGSNNKDDSTEFVSFTPAAVRLCARDKDKNAFVNFHPIGTLQDASTLYVNELDDLLFATPEQSIEFVFEIPKSALEATAEKGVKLLDGAFFEFKRNARVDVPAEELAYVAKTTVKLPAIIRKNGNMPTP